MQPLPGDGGSGESCWGNLLSEAGEAYRLWAVSCSAASMPHGILKVRKVMKVLPSPAGFS